MELEKALSAHQAGNDALKNQLAIAEQQRSMFESSLNDTRRQFASELEKQRDALKRSEERLEGAEKRALLEIDRERQLTRLAQQEVQQLRYAFQETLERQTAETANYQKVIAELGQRLGVADGLLQAQKERQVELVTQFDTLRERLSTKTNQVTLLGRELELRSQQVSALESEISATAEQSIQAKRRSRNPKTPT